MTHFRYAHDFEGIEVFADIEYDVYPAEPAHGPTYSCGGYPGSPARIEITDIDTRNATVVVLIDGVAVLCRPESEGGQAKIAAALMLHEEKIVAAIEEHEAAKAEEMAIAKSSRRRIFG